MTVNKESLLVDLLKLRAQAGFNTDARQYLELSKSVFHGQIFRVLDRYERLAGYICWASFSKESMRRFIKYGIFPSKFEEWNEGMFLVVLDIFLITSKVRFGRSMLLECLPSRRYIFFIRRGYAYALQARNRLALVMKRKVPNGSARRTNSALRSKVSS